MATLRYWDGLAWRLLFFGGGSAVSDGTTPTEGSRDGSADLPWTTVRTGVFARTHDGNVELAGKLSLTASDQPVLLFRMPSHFPMAERSSSYPVACQDSRGMSRVGVISVSKDNREVVLESNAGTTLVFFDSVRWRAA